MLRSTVRGAMRAASSLGLRSPQLAASARQLASSNAPSQSSASVFGAASMAPVTEAAGSAGPSTPPGPPPSAALRFAKVALTASAALLGGGAAYVAGTYDTQQTEALFGPQGRVARAVAGTSVATPVACVCAALLEARVKAAEHIHYFADPSSPKLLPDLPAHAASYTRTLVLDLDGVLVKSDWNRERGWRTFKRPGCDAFLKHMSQYYELVVFTEQLSTYGEPILERLDPQRYVSYRLYRDATRYSLGVHCRDLSHLNRPLERCLLVTCEPKVGQLQPSNVLVVKPWDLSPNDTTLLDLLPFLESIVRRNVTDTRTVLSSYAEEAAATGKDASTIFRERSSKMQAFLKEREAAPRPLLRGIGRKRDVVREAVSKDEGQKHKRAT